VPEKLKKGEKFQNILSFFYILLFNKKAATCYDKFLLLPACFALVLVKIKTGKERKRNFER